MNINENDFVGLSKLNLSNFKSIKSSPREEIELAPLTLLCGENSSGKSTVLHSILLQLQNLSSEKLSSNTFPLNGNLIKLNDYKSILHASNLKDIEDETDMEMGIIFNTLKGNPSYFTPSYKLMNNLKVNFHLIPEESEGIFSAFPKNLKTLVEMEINYHLPEDPYSPPESMINKDKFILEFSQIPYTNEKVKVFQFENGKANLSSFSNEQWQCKFTKVSSMSTLLEAKYNENDEIYDTKYSDFEEQDTGNRVFAGIEFSNGIPAKVYKRVLIADYLSEKLALQLKTLSEDSDTLVETMEWIEDIEITDSGINTDELRTNKEKAISIANQIIRYFSLLNEEEFEHEVREDIYKLFNQDPNNRIFQGRGGDEIATDAFTLHWNMSPWANVNYSDYYYNKEHLALDLIELVNEGPDEHYELIQSVIGTILDEYIVELHENGKSFEEIKPTIIEDLKEIFDNKFFLDLQIKLFENFESIFKDDEEFFFVDHTNIRDEFDNKDLEQINDILGELKNVSKDIRYLGPLRMLENDENKVTTFEDHIPIGLNGEYFFNYHFEQKTLKLNVNDKPLSEKFNDALKFFELADSFDTEYVPQTDSVVGYIKPLGIEKNIKMTELGVGFSQLAPIILLCLTSTPGTTILLEQPELHLHPKVQQKFADFIVEMIEKNDLQIILETHSDHILNRIRRRVAQAKLEENDSSLFQRCTILFAERENGVTSFRNAKLTESGMFDLTDYPDGFFDQGAEDAFYILKASLEDGNS